MNGGVAAVFWENELGAGVFSMFSRCSGGFSEDTVIYCLIATSPGAAHKFTSSLLNQGYTKDSPYEGRKEQAGREEERERERERQKERGGA